MTLPGDGHVHSEWSWDTRVGDMAGSCARAVELGLPSIAFTEHLDHTVWRITRTGPDAAEPLLSLAGVFQVLAHIDYPVRSWPAAAGPFDPAAFEDEYRHALRATAASGRALEVNTRLPLAPAVLRWWHEEGGDAVTFGSDAHHPAAVGHGLADAARMAEAHGFRPGRDPHDLWGRADRHPLG